MLPWLAVLILIPWLWLTPPGLIGKADAIGYAVCHRIPSHTFFLADRALPLCARCSGMYLGALGGLILLFRRGRLGGLPARRTWVLFGVATLLFAVDGINSYLNIFQSPNLYPPENWLRLVTGSLIGTAIAAFLVPAFHQTMWASFEPQPILPGLRWQSLLFAVAGLADLAILSENPLLLYPLAILSALVVPLTLGLAYTMFWVLIRKKDNSFTNWRQLFPYLMLGLVTALVQIGVVDFIRFSLTQTWSGFNLP